MAQMTLVIIWACRVVMMVYPLLLLASAGIGIGMHGAVGNVVIKRSDSKKENRLVSTEKEINNTTNIPLGPNNASHHLGPPCVLSVAAHCF